MTISIKDTVYELFKKEQDFSSQEGIITQLPLNYIFPYAVGPENKFGKNIKIIKDVLGNINYIMDCLITKVIHKLDYILLNIVSLLAANISVGEDCYYYEELLETLET
ncbi:5460_t:CDS:2 [Dentiscutata heterogama]|uniref:5460_t:CDS:1 n=1 Tax=Dentiscutata heterogama TaxID=1316150 RepID=A0ACA9JWJ5_9GLOM|nr:5460_t:CDS:2 [Dentiscutata heterogama]